MEPIDSFAYTRSPNLTETSFSPEYTEKNSPWFIKIAFPSPLIKNIRETVPLKTDLTVEPKLVAIFIPLLKVSILLKT